MLDNRTFKDQLETDQEIFLNIDEFGEMHELQIKNTVYEKICVISTGTREKSLNERSFRGVYTGFKTLYCKLEDMIVPVQGQIVKVDDVRYTVLSSENQFGILKLILEGYHQT